MNSSYKDLGAAGRAWVTCCLTPDRSWAISRQIMAEDRLPDGSVLGMGVPNDVDLPADVKLQYAPETYGFHLTQLTSGDVLLALFERIEGRYGPCFLVVEADLLGPDDPYLRELPPGAVLVDGQDFYYIEPLADATDADRSVLLRHEVSTDYPLVAFILQGTAPDEIADAFRRHDAGALGNRVMAIINTIFDADGYSIWLPNSVRSALMGQGG